MKNLIFFIFIFLNYIFGLPKIAVELKLTDVNVFKGMPVYIKVKFHNLGKEKFKFVLYNNLFYHFDFNAKNNKNIEINKNINYNIWKIKKEKLNNSYDKIITLGYNDSYTINLDLSKWLDFDKPGYYYISGEFIPNPMFDNTNKIIFKTSSVSFYIKPNKDDIINGFSDENIIEQTDFIKKNVKCSSEIPPYKVIEKFIISEKNKEWDNYFKYIDLDNYLKNSYFSISLAERYEYADAKERELIIEEFKEYLKNIVDYDIQSYKILETKIIDNKAEILLYTIEKVYKEKFVKKFNPKTQQIEIKWITDPSNIFIRKKTTKYILFKGKNSWLINEKIIITTE